MSTRYSLPPHLSAADHDRAALARTFAALVLVAGVVALTVFVGAVYLPQEDATAQVPAPAPDAADGPGGA